MKHPEEVGRVSFPASDQAAVIMKPGEEPFDLPATTHATKRTTILGEMTTTRPLRCDELDAVRPQDMRVERITVVRLIANQSFGEIGKEARVESRFNEPALIRRSAGHVDGDRKTMAVADRHDFAAVTASSRANGGAPFFAELKFCR
jgi:hypothetical protein